MRTARDLHPLSKSPYGTAFLITLLLLTLLLLCSCSFFDARPSVPEARDGSLDLRDWEFSGDGSLRLTGEWEFHPGALYDPSGGEPLPAPPRSMEIPGFWNRQHRDLSPSGYATLHLTVLLPETPERFGLYIEEVQTAYRLFVNGELLIENGRVATDLDSYEAQNTPRIHFFDPDQRRMELVMQVANFRDVKAGMLEAPMVGTPEQISLRHYREVGVDLFFFGGIFIMAIYYLIICFYRGWESTSFFFSLLCLSLALRSGLTGSRFIPWLVPSLGFEFLTSMEFISVYVAALALYFFFRSRFPRESWPPVTYITLGTIGFLVLSAAVTPIRYHVPLFLLFELYTLIMIVSILTGAIIAVRRKRPGAISFLISFAVLATLIPLDMLYYNIGTGSSFVLHYGLFIFILIHASSLAYRFTRLEKEARLYAANLEDKNATLSSQLNKQNRELNFIQRSLSSTRRKDFLTGLFNEELLTTHLSKLDKEQRAGKGNEALTLISLDIDDFDEINRQRGKSYGDFLLIHCATLLEHNADEMTKVYRGRGDEFVILLRGKTREQAISYVEQFKEDIRKGRYLPRSSGKNDPDVIPHLSFSVGICHIEEGRQEEDGSPTHPDRMLEQAREARRAAQRTDEQAAEQKVVFYSAKTGSEGGAP